MWNIQLSAEEARIVCALLQQLRERTRSTTLRNISKSILNKFNMSEDELRIEWEMY